MNDNEIPELNTQKFQPEIASGIYYNTKRFYAGFAIQNMLQSRKKENVNTLLGYPPANQQHYYLMSSYVLPISKNVDFSPIVLMKFVKNAPINIDVNASFIFFDKLWTGLSWRKDDSIDVILQYQLNQ